MTVIFDPTDPSFFNDRYRRYALLRDNAPIARLGSVSETAHVVTRYSDVESLLRDPDMLVKPFPDTIPDYVGTGAASRFYRHTLPRVDPPDHTRVRRLTRAAFNINTFKKMRQQVEEVIVRGIEALPQSGEADFIESFASRVPGEIACRLVHIDPADGAPFLEKASHLLAILNQGLVDDSVRERADRAGEFYFSYFNTMVDNLKGKLPNDDVVGALIDSERAEGLSRDELLVAVLNLLLASYHTTVIALSNAMVHLLRNREEVQRLKADPSLAISAWDELLRFDAPVHFVPRYARADTEVRGLPILAGQRLLLCLASANHDERKFERPADLDIGRKSNPHFSFATGPHLCIGAQLSRMEGDIFLRNIFKYYPDISLTSDRLTKTHDVSFPHFTRVPVHLGKRAV